MRARVILLGFLLIFTTLQVFAREKGFTGWMKSAELSTMLQKKNENRMFPGTVQGRLNGTAIQYRARFIPFLLNMEHFESRWGMIEVWYKANTAQMLKAGFTEFSHTSFVDLSGTTLHQVTWVLISKQQDKTKAVTP